MRNRVGVILFLALVSGLLAAYLAFRFLRQPAAGGVAQAAEAPTVGVVVAARNMEPGHELTQQDIRVIDWPASALPEGFAAAADEVVGRGVISPLRVNEPILFSKIATPEGGAGLQATIDAGRRGMAVRVNDVIGVSGWIRRGHRVDVLVTLDQGMEVEEPVTKMVLQDILVLGVGQDISQSNPDQPVEAGTVILAVTPEEAEKLALAATKGQILLALRNMLDRDTVTTDGARPRELLGEQRVARSGPVRAAPRRPASVQVEVIRGTQKSTETVDGSGGGP